MNGTLKAVATVIFSVGLVACGGGGGDEDSSASGNPGTDGSGTASNEQIVAYVKSSNIDFVPSANGRPAGTWRWSGTPAQHVLVYVPTPTSGNSTELDYSTKTNNSIALINAKLTGSLVLEATDSIPTSGNYIRISYGTSYVPAGSTNYNGFCANVSIGPNLGNVILPDSQNGIASSPVYINLGNGHCDVTQDIVTHEFGHALGLANHFDGFGGDGPATASDFWDVLATLYGNPQSTTASNLVVKRAAD